MNNKIPLKKFADLLASEAGCGVEDAQSFVKGLFQFVADRVHNGESVDIRGLGVFSASPNVAEPVKFEPSIEFAEELNSPFAMFQPIVIGDEISVDEINAIQSDESHADESDVAEKTEPMVEPDVVADGTESVIAISETSDAISENETDSVGMSDSDDDSSPIENESETDKNDALSDSESASLPTTEDLSEEDLYADREPEDCRQSAQDEMIPESVPVPESDDQEAKVCTYLPEEEEEYVEYYDAPKSRFGIGFAIGLMTGLIIGALAIAAYAIYFVNNGEKLF